MRRYPMMLLAFAAACHSAPTAPKPPLLDPPAAIDQHNLTGATFAIWTLIIGTDMIHTSAGTFGQIDPDSARHTGPACATSGQVAGERDFLMLAVEPQSPLDLILSQFTNGDSRCSSCRPPATEAWMDSLSKGQIDLPAFYAAHPGLVAATPAFDPAPAGWPAEDTVPWRWTVSGPGAATIALDTADHACVGP